MVNTSNIVDHLSADETNDCLQPTESSSNNRNRKVVAFPSRGRMSVAEAVSTSNSKLQQQQPQKPRPRSLSAGRTRTRPQDLVQDIYDRMGLSLKRSDPIGIRGRELLRDRDDPPPQQLAVTTSSSSGHLPVTSTSEPSMRARGSQGAATGNPPQLQDRYRTTANNTRGRGRLLEEQEQRRSRSLSRGRKLALQWPPPEEGGGDSFSPTGSPLRVSTPATAKQTGTTPTRAGYGNATEYRAFSYKNNSSKDWNDEKKQEQVGASSVEEYQKEILKVTPPSVKARATVYGGTAKPKSNRNMMRSYDQQYAAQFAVREKPPKVDIYGSCNDNDDDANVGEEKKEDDLVQGSAANHPQQEHASPLPVASDCAVEHARQRMGINNNNSGGGGKNKQNWETSSASSSRSTKSAANVASTFLAAIQPPRESLSSNRNLTAPMAEITASNEDQVINDGSSVAMSSVSVEEFAPATTYRREGKKLSWQERNRVPAYSSSGGVGVYPTAATTNITGKNLSAEAIERIVDERVQAQFLTLESRMEASMRRWMKKMDEKMMTRLEAMEEKISGMNSVLEESMKGSRNDIR